MYDSHGNPDEQISSLQKRYFFSVTAAGISPNVGSQRPGRPLERPHAAPTKASLRMDKKSVATTIIAGQAALRAQRMTMQPEPTRVEGQYARQLDVRTNARKAKWLSSHCNVHSPEFFAMTLRSSSPTGPLAEQPVQSPRRWLQVLLFLLIYGVFQWAYQSLRTSSWDDWFIHQLTVRPAAWLVDFASPSEGVQALGYKLVWPGGGIALRAGCDGFEVIGLFIAAVLVSDAGWRRGLLALGVGCLIIWALNQLRIAALYAAVRYDHSWFDSLHTGWGPLFMIGAVATIYYWMVRRPRVPVTA